MLDQFYDDTFDPPTIDRPIFNAIQAYKGAVGEISKIAAKILRDEGEVSMKDPRLWSWQVEKKRCGEKLLKLLEG